MDQKLQDLIDEHERAAGHHYLHSSHEPDTRARLDRAREALEREIRARVPLEVS